MPGAGAIHHVECGSDLSGVCQIRWALDGVSTHWTLSYHGCEQTPNGLECSVSMLPVPIEEGPNGYEVQLAECEASVDSVTSSLEQTQAFLRSRMNLLAETQAALDRCQAAQVAPDPAGAWVLGGLALLGVAARWLR